MWFFKFYNFCLELFCSNNDVFTIISKNCYKTKFFVRLTLKMSFAPMFRVTFVFTMPKYVSIDDFNEIENLRLSEVYPNFLMSKFVKFRNAR